MKRKGGGVSRSSKAKGIVVTDDDLCFKNVPTRNVLLADRSVVMPVAALELTLIPRTAVVTGGRG